MKNCVVTENFSCDPNKVWLYLTKPTLSGWRTDLAEYEESTDGMQCTERLKDGSSLTVQFSRKEKPRCLNCTFSGGKLSGTFFAILLGGGDSTSLECTLEVNGLGLFVKPQKLLKQRLEMLHKALGC